MSAFLPSLSGKRRKTLSHMLHATFSFILLLLLGTSFALGSSFVQVASAETLATLPNTVPAVVAHSKLQGPLPASQSLSLSIGLRLRNQSLLNSYLQDIKRPHSLDYHRYLTPAQFTQAFGPTQAIYDALLHYLQSSRFTITNTYTHRMLIGFSGTAGQVEQALHVAINTYLAPNGQSFYANASDPLLPSALVGEVQTVSGLNDVAHYQHTPLSVHSASSASSAAQPQVSCPQPGPEAYLPSQYAAGYNLNGLYSQGYLGEGQTVALIEFASFHLSDIQTYETCYAKSQTNVQTVLVNGPISTYGVSQVEADAEVTISAAPHLGEVRIYEASNDTNGGNLAMAQIVQDAPAIVTFTWVNGCENDIGIGEAQLENNFLIAAAAQGQSFLAASGYSGSSGCLFDGNNNSALNADDPASQPFATAVGGTQLHLNNDNSYNSEQVWDDPTGQGGGSGGGISQFWTEPSAWESAPGVVNQYSTGAPCNAPQGQICREVPDVSLNADWLYHGYLVYCTAQEDQFCKQDGPLLNVGSTAEATAMWAGFTALINQELLKQGSFNIGYLNPLLYQIASNSSMYANDFHDVTTGSNDYGSYHGGLYPATIGYDLATGLGSYNAGNLARDLISLALSQNGSRSSPTSTIWYFAEGSVGGGFQEYLTLQNPSTSQTANVTVTYLIQGQSSKAVLHQVPPSQRQTIDVDKDLNTSPGGSHLSLAAIVTSDIGIVAERPMYFNAVGVRSGTDVVGATNPGTSYYFSEADSTKSGQANYSTFLTMLNPSSTQTAHVTITYYTGSCDGNGQPACATEAITIGPLQRQTASPTDPHVGLHTKLSISVSSDIPVVVERPMYFTNNIPNAGGLTSGAASEVGATSPGTDWLFAEGYTGNGFQEYLELANFSASAANATVTLEYTNGSTQAIQVPVAAYGHVEFDVHNANTHPTGVCNPSPCHPTSSLSAEVTSDNPIVADRLMYFHYGSIQGGTDVVGEAAPARSVYAFAEGYTGNGFQEFLTLQNPTASSEIVVVTLFTQKPPLVLEEEVTVQSHTRTTININAWLNPIAGGSVSMSVQALGKGAAVVAERPIYFNYGGDLGGSDVIGYTGG